ncbi:MAG: esterase family protein [Myxococcota bacterium]
MRAIHHLIDSPQLGRQMHVWQYGHFGPPVLVFPSAAGFAHEWHAQGMIEALSPWINAGRLKLYCPESNVAAAWTRREEAPHLKHLRHQRYEAWILETLVPAIEADCRTAQIPIGTVGCSLGGLYAANMALKHSHIFRWALCMSGRYEVRPFLDGLDTQAVYFDNPLAYVPNLAGAALEHVQTHTHLTLVCGQGKYEEGCIEETRALAGALKSKNIPHMCDIWGMDVAHDWSWWRRQVVFHLQRRLGQP